MNEPATPGSSSESGEEPSKEPREAPSEKQIEQQGAPGRAADARKSEQAGSAQAGGGPSASGSASRGSRGTPGGRQDRRRSAESEDLPVIQKTYDLAVWLLPQIQRFPRAYRHTLGARIEGQLLDLLDDLLETRFAPGGAAKAQHLRLASSRLLKLRYTLRLAVELRYLPLGKQEHIAEQLGEIGRMVGGWLKGQRAA